MTAIVFAYQLDTADLVALRSYAIEHGPKWKDELQLDWYHARAHGERGSILHGLRNNLGPSWLVDFRFDTPIEFPNLRKLPRRDLEAILNPLGREAAPDPGNVLLWAARRERRRRASR